MDHIDFGNYTMVSLQRKNNRNKLFNKKLTKYLQHMENKRLKTQT